MEEAERRDELEAVEALDAGVAARAREAAALGASALDRSQEGEAGVEGLIARACLVRAAERDLAPETLDLPGEVRGEVGHVGERTLRGGGALLGHVEDARARAARERDARP